MNSKRGILHKILSSNVPKHYVLENYGRGIWTAIPKELGKLLNVTEFYFLSQILGILTQFLFGLLI